MFQRYLVLAEEAPQGAWEALGEHSCKLAFEQPRGQLWEQGQAGSSSGVSGRRAGGFPLVPVATCWGPRAAPGPVTELSVRPVAHFPRQTLSL